ncbi:hypothetical protein Ahia01_000575900, partial [Argonauta hians]
SLALMGGSMCVCVCVGTISLALMGGSMCVCVCVCVCWNYFSSVNGYRGEKCIDLQVVSLLHYNTTCGSCYISMLPYIPVLLHILHLMQHAQLQSF